MPMQPHKYKEKRQIARFILQSCDHHRVNDELSTGVRPAERLAEAGVGKKVVDSQYVGNDPASHSIASEGASTSTYARTQERMYT